MRLIVSEAVERKLWAKDNRRIRLSDVEECFENWDGGLMYDDREEHLTHPPTYWFISETFSGRRLKVVFIEKSPEEFTIKTAYPPSKTEERIYEERERT